MSPQTRGRLHLYTGDGKGKTTAALGLLLRFLGRGGRARLIQFDKSAQDRGELYGERSLLQKMEGLDFTPTGLARFDPVKKEFRFENTAGDFEEARRGLELSQAALSAGYGLVVLDEILSLPLTKLGTRDQVLEVVEVWEQQDRPCELVFTGHVTWPQLVDRADLVTQMRKVKHYFDQGHEARLSVDF